ncbi:MAG: hypothetical protein HY896_11615 [Deltaproteobacteria bacterium]|nr:hypothetical protein [Deltaproteobacteria bacterium]
MKPIPRCAGLPAAVLILLLLCSAALANPDIAILVDGLPLDAKGLAVKDEVFIPAWILENYAHTKVKWTRGGNVLEILTAPQGEAIPRQEGIILLRIGVYLKPEGYVRGKDTRLYLLNVDPKEFTFADGKTPGERAHEATVDRIGISSRPVRDYLRLSPTDRFAPKGWTFVSMMPREEVIELAATVDRYEQMYRTLYYDLITNLVIGKEQAVRSAVGLDDSLKGIKIENVPVREDGSAEVKLGNGMYFLYARMLHGNVQIVWDLPVAVRGGTTTVELSNRNAALAQ